MKSLQLSFQNLFVKITIAILLCYLICPNFFERNLFFNEVLSLFGLLTFLSTKKIEKDNLLIYFYLLLAWTFLHAIISLFFLDNWYGYLRNLVIFYSMFTFFLGYSFHHKTTTILLSIRKFLFLLIVPFIFFPVKFLDRFSVALLFPLILISKNKKQNYLLLAIASLIYSFTYSSATLVIISLFFLSIIIFKDYKAFISFLILLTCVFVVTFIHLIPYLDISQYNYTYQNSEKSIHALMEGHFLLKIDGNTTWRLVLWKQIIVDLFPRNLLGLGFGTPLLKYFPIENYEKIPLLPYVLGAHNSFIYLFGRLGIPAIVLVFIIMKNILKDFFLYRKEYIQHSTEWIFLSFFIISIISLFNPTLESPIYASMFWFFLGLTVRTILSRKHESAL